jgi:DNA-binding Lrp family transcriptional regulator
MRFRVLRALQQQPGLNQRQLAELLSVSLGKTNYLLRALLDKGLLKARNFGASQNKMFAAEIEAAFGHPCSASVKPAGRDADLGPCIFVFSIKELAQKKL